MIKTILLNILCLFTMLVDAQTVPITLTWDGLKTNVLGSDTIQTAHFKDAYYGADFGMLPTFIYSKELGSTNGNYNDYEVSLTNTEVEKADYSSKNISGTSQIGANYKILSTVVSSRGEDIFEVQVLPLRKLEDGSIERLLSFDLELKQLPKLKSKSADIAQGFTENSVLASGNWVKIAVQESGMYKLTFDDIKSMGLDPQNIRVFGNGGKMLDIKFNNRIHDDLVENAVWYELGADGKFNSGDFILFYAQGPNTWTYNSSKKLYEHILHKFDNKAYYFLTSDAGEGKRISKQVPITKPYTFETSTFDDYRFIEPEKENLLHSGAMWFSSKMYPNEEVKVSFNFPNIVTNEKATVELNAVARTTKASSTFSIYQGGDFLSSFPIANSSLSTTGDFARMGSTSNFFSPNGEDVEITIKFTSYDAAGIGWYDYLRVSARRALQLVGNQLSFRDKNSFGNDKISKFNIANAQSGLVVLDVSNCVNPIEMITTMDGNTLSFKQQSDDLAEFIAFYPKGGFAKPEVIGKVANQNLHGVGQTDYLIITHSKFIDQAERLAELHRAEGLSVTVTELSKIYPEFSSGQRDITAIRWYVKSIYDKFDKDEKLRYVLLFGDGTYDNRKGAQNNPNFIPTCQSQNSLHQSDTYVSDDYFAFMDNSEGTGGSTDRIDLGIGRLPVQSVTQAKQVVDKIEHYMNNDSRLPWKNRVVFVADDKDGNDHATKSNAMADVLTRNFPGMEINKIFIHAYERETLASGPSYPEANRLVKNSIDQGTLIWNYTGHGGDVGLADEKVITLAGIKNYTNLNTLPLWVTATCEFAPYDLKDFTSAGEEVLLNPRGGGIALFTTTRLVYSNSNYEINKKFFEFVFARDENGERYRLGDVFHLTKRNVGTRENKRKFALIGDPALLLNYPTNEVVTSEINGTPVEENIDTLMALKDITISGFINKPNGEFASDYNGYIYPKIYDKIAEKSTIVDDVNPRALKFKVWENILYKGKTKVENGEFSFSFRVPKDIDYTEGFGKIVYYASSDNKVEANGCFENIVVGGFYEGQDMDENGPEIQAFLNTPNFKNGDLVNPNPMFVANIWDETGVNTSGASIGHDVVAVLDNDPNTIMVLNNFYEPSVESNGGQLKFNLAELSNGPHSLFLRVWDIYNNPSTATISFTVDNHVNPQLNNLLCYPNPAKLSDETVRFKFSHDRPDQVISVTIEIFDTNGNQIITLGPILKASDGNNVDLIDWDLQTKGGQRVSNGIYLYRTIISDNENNVSTDTKKLIIY